MPRRSLAALATTALLAATALPAGATTDDTITGTAAATSVPITVAHDVLTVWLGGNSLLATTDPATADAAPWSGVELTLADIGGAAFGEYAVASDGTTSAVGGSIDELTLLGPVQAEVTQLLAVADEVAGTATAGLGTLDLSATVLQGVDLAATVTDAVATVDAAGAAATHTLAFAGIDLGLASLLDAVLDGLPLDDLVALADQFGIALPADIDAAGDVVAAIDALIAAVADAEAGATAVEDAAAALLAAEALDPLADFGDVAAYQTMADDVAALVPDGDAGQVLAALNAITALLLDADFLALGCAVTDPGVDLVAAVDEVATCLADHLTAYADALAALATPLAALQDAVAAYLAAVTAATDAADVLAADAGALDGVTALIGDVLAALGDVDLVNLAEVEVSQSVRAVGGDTTASHATNTCTVAALTPLDLPSVPVADCAASSAVTDALATVNAAIAQVLDTVGGVDAGDGVQLGLFDDVSRGVTAEDDGTTRATSHVEVLHLTVPDVTVTPCEVADGLVCALGVDLSGPLQDALDALDGVLDTAQTTATDALTSVADVLTALDATLDVDAAAGAQAVVDAALAVLTGVLGTLDLGDLGSAQGVTVPGIDVVVDPQLDAAHLVVAGDPVAGAPDPDDDDGSLPNTGGGAALLAIVALGLGGVLLRRRDQRAG